MFSNTAEYALRAIVHLATNRERAATAQDISKATKVPQSYLSKVLLDLVTAGVVSSQRGPNGGFSLARDPSELTVLDVVNAVDPIHRIETCPLGIPSHGKQLCRLHSRLDETIRVVEETLRASSITDMCTPSKGGSKCLFPTVTVGGKEPTRKTRGGEKEI